MDSKKIDEDVREIAALRAPSKTISNNLLWSFVALFVLGCGIGGGFYYWNRLEREAVEWRVAQQLNSTSGFETYLKSHPAGRFAEEAAKSITALRATSAPPSVKAAAPAKPAINTAVQAEAPDFSARPLTSEAESRLSPGSEFRECPTCPLMVVLPPGEFSMGSAQTEIAARRANDNEGPAHPVTISRPFAVGKFEVTFSEWDACVADGGCRGYRPGDNGWGRGKLPVINVSWDDAKLYVRWLSGKTGKIYRLLSEAEWEYAARAKSTTRFYFGDDARGLCKYANVADESGSSKVLGKAGFNTWLVCNDGYANTAPVGSFTPNAFRLHDMHGNVVEWVEDIWHDDYKGAPSDGSPWTSGADPQFRIGRSGSHYHLEAGLTSAFRLKYQSTSYGNLIGLRVARTLTP